MKEIYQKVTDEILEKLKEGVAPWRMPYSFGGNMPLANLATKRAYRGVNVILLSTRQWAKGYSSPWWIGYRQAQALGGHVKKGAKSMFIITPYIRKDEDGEEKIVGYGSGRVFNIDECELPAEKIPAPPDPAEHDPIEAAEAILATREDLPHTNFINGIIPSYNPSLDIVNMQPLEAFTSAEEYYSSYFHELVHSTGHESRLGRELKTWRDKPAYSFEELIAETGSAFLCAQAGIEQQTLDNSASYIDGWLRALGNNPDWIVKAAAQAQKAADWISTRETTQQEAAA